MCSSICLPVNASPSSPSHRARSTMTICSKYNKINRCVGTLSFRYLSTSPSTSAAGQKAHATAMPIFRQPTSHNVLCILPVLTERNPPTTAPTTTATNAPSLWNLFSFSRHVTKRRGSVATSCSILVSTTVGMLSWPKAREATIWPADWKLSSAMGKHWRQSISSLRRWSLPSTSADCINPAATSTMPP